MTAFRLGAVLLLASTACNSAPGGGTATLATAEDSVSYIVGFQVGSSLKQQGAPAKEGPFTNGLRDAMKGAAARMNPQQMQATVAAYQQKQRDSVMAANAVAGTANDSAGKNFLAENAKKEGVKTTPSGLQYKVLREGKGAHPKATSQVTVHYKGTLLNGTPFDSSYGGAPVTFPLNQVIPGWTEGVQLMSPGAKYQFWLPASLAYGETGSPPAIGPNQTLQFEVELVSFK